MSEHFYNEKDETNFVKTGNILHSDSSSFLLPSCLNSSDSSSNSSSSSVPLLLSSRFKNTFYGSATTTHHPPISIATKANKDIMQRSPLTFDENAALVVWNSNTVYKNEIPQMERYQIKIVRGNSVVKQYFFPELSDGVWRSYEEFCWLRKILIRNHPNYDIPLLPPNYYFRWNYEPNVVKERIRGLQEFLQKCLRIKNIVSDVMFHLFVETDLSIEAIKKQNENDFNNSSPSFASLMCLGYCRSNKTDNLDINYSDFKRELETALKESKNKMTEN